ncbi:cell division transport system permease protein [Maritalea mobilis]|uniref:Cell division transport system permease protein n=1 Tax=Maritalea mobilis TaxID=483324 RepID=A0A4R6VEX8_9HYPH|nr:ABC transporter permease [Maritalea mobilis]TDQ61585.1 cell division transport system permease protein [Maritalea mobilis]
MIDQFLNRNRTEIAIVPRSSIAGRTLALLVAIMTFLSCVTFGAVYLVQNSAIAWSSEVGREITIQLQPVDGDEMTSNVRTAIALALDSPGVGSAKELTIEDSERLLSPWLGDEFDLEGFDLPRLVVVHLSNPNAFDQAALTAKLEQSVPGATIDTHKAWQQKLNAMSGTIVFSGLLALMLIMAATILAVIFATNGAMASNREIVDVLHFIGAPDRYIASAFQSRFFAIGLQGGIVGGAAALIFFILAGIITNYLLPSQSAEQVELLFGQFSLGWLGIFGLIIVVAIIAGLTSITSRITVHRFLAQVAP